jgi:hypothetical protein
MGKTSAYFQRDKEYIRLAMSSSPPHPKDMRAHHVVPCNDVISTAEKGHPSAWLKCVAPLLVFTGTLWGQSTFPEIRESSGQPEGDVQATLDPLPPRPDYHDFQNWAFLPSSLSRAESSTRPKDLEAPAPPAGARKQKLKVLQQDLQADVFFIHPTMLLEGPEWNADVGNVGLNAEVDRWPIRHQASAFSGVGRVFAPRYRQAHIRIFDLGDSLSWAAAEVAYSDVKRAFEHFLKHWNDGRPIVLAGHSQGSFHGRTLLQEFFDGGPLQDQLVAAYFPGMDMYPSEFDTLGLCSEPNEIGCLCTWMTYGEGFLPRWLTHPPESKPHEPVLCVHPVSWGTEVGLKQQGEHLGVVRPSYRLSKPHAITAEVRPEGVLWIPPPHVLGGRWLQRDNWHSGDINLFWVNVYKNAQLRTTTWHAEHAR